MRLTPETARDRIIDALEAHPQGLSQDQLFRNVGGLKQIVKAEIDELIREGRIEVRKLGRAHVHTLSPKVN